MKQLAYAYMRVSTQRQGRNGFGLSAQRTTVTQYAAANGLKIGKFYIEIETGTNNNRSELSKALRTCQANKGILLIAKLDRLSRNVKFISALMDSGTEFVAVDYPQADRLLLHILAAIAEYEARMIRDRTRVALQERKCRGGAFGVEGRAAVAKQYQQSSRSFLIKMKIHLLRLKNEGITTVRAVTEELNRRQVPTFNGKGHRWHVRTVHNIMKSEIKKQNENETYFSCLHDGIRC